MDGTLLKSISKDERERAVFRSRRMYQTDMESNRITAERRGEERGIKIGEKRGEKRGIKIGEERGIEIGEKRGVKIGEERGIKIGEKRADERREADRNEAARIMKENGVPMDIIAKAMKLTPDEIERLESGQGKGRKATRKPGKQK